jgi:hypothetical protein
MIPGNEAGRLINSFARLVRRNAVPKGATQSAPQFAVSSAKSKNASTTFILGLSAMDGGDRLYKANADFVLGVSALDGIDRL